MSQAPPVGSYYMPYDSGSDTDQDTDDESDLASQESVGFDSRLDRDYDPRYAILRTAGPKMDTPADRLKYRNFHQTDSWGEWDPSTNITSLANYTYSNPAKATRTSLISIKSTNRDRAVYPTAYNFQIKLPRVYQRVTRFQFTQMTFPKPNGAIGLDTWVTSSLRAKFILDGVAPECISSCLAIVNCTTSMNGLAMIEQGRTAPSGSPLLTTVAIPDGIYSNPQLAQELTVHANSTPPLNLISYPNFRDIFMNTRDISVLFNEPGDTFLSKATNYRYGGHTKENIMNTYYTQQHIDLFVTITEQVAFVAYYFPILKELVATHRSEPFLNTGGMSFDEVFTRVMGPFQGFDHPVYSTLCTINQTILDGYRKYLTFEMRNVNQYRFSYDSQQNRFAIVHDTLHTSIQRDLAKKYSQTLSQELAVTGLHANSFKTMKTDAIGYTSIYKHLETNLSTIIGNYHFGTAYQYQGGSQHITQEATYDAVADLHQDEAFTSMFQYQSTIGRIYGNYSGISMQFTNFIDYHSTLSSYYQIVQSTNQALTAIQIGSQREFYSYVSTKYSGILPDEMIHTQSYLSNQSVPVIFPSQGHVYFPGVLPSEVPATKRDMVNTNIFYAIDPTSTASSCLTACCREITNLVYSWYSCIPVNTTINTLSYRLGITNILPNNFSLVSTFTNIVSTSYLNFLMQINEEQGFNNMDIAMNENYDISNETTGQIKLVNAKILMGNVAAAAESQTIIQNPIVFQPPLRKLDRLSFKVFYDDDAITPAWLYVPSYLDANEWNAIFQIEEEVGDAAPATGWGETPTLPIPDNPADLRYLFLTKK